MVGRGKGQPYDRMAGLASAGGDDRAATYLPRFMAGGESNPLGARALYLGKTIYRIHGTNQPSTIGKFVSSGCIRMLNDDAEDLYSRVKAGTRVVVSPGGAPVSASSQCRSRANFIRSPSARRRFTRGPIATNKQKYV